MKKETIKEARKRKRRRKRRLVAGLTVLFILAASAFVVVKVFTVEEVRVEGNVLYEDDLIAKTVLTDEYSWNSLYVYLKYKFVKPEAVPFIDTMEIKLSGPHTLCIEVYEKGIMGYLYVESAGENVYFDKDGFVVETSQSIIEDVPEIQGIFCEDVVLYEKLPIDSTDLKDMLTLTQTLKRNNLEPDAIIYGESDSPVLVYDNVRIPIGSQDLLTQKVERISKILPSLNGMSGVLHLENWTEETTNIVFDKDPETESPEEEVPEDGEEKPADEGAPEDSPLDPERVEEPSAGGTL